MARVIFVSSACKEFTQGVEEIEVPGATIFQLVRALERRFPEITRCVEKRVSIAVDGEVIQAWASPVSPDSEVTLFPRIAGG